MRGWVGSLGASPRGHRGRALTQLRLQERRERRERFDGRRSVGAPLWSPSLRSRRSGEARASDHRSDGPTRSAATFRTSETSQRGPVGFARAITLSDTCSPFHAGSTRERTITAHGITADATGTKKPAAVAAGRTSCILTFPNLAQFGRSARKKCWRSASLIHIHVRETMLR
jgi:hypothetical protein